MSSIPFNASAIAVECSKLIEFTKGSSGMSPLNISFLAIFCVLVAFVIFASGMATDNYMVNYHFKKACMLQGAEGDEAMFELFKFHMKLSRGQR